MYYILYMYVLYIKSQSRTKNKAHELIGVRNSTCPQKVHQLTHFLQVKISVWLGILVHITIIGIIEC